jgi:hypothetical protein
LVVIALAATAAAYAIHTQQKPAQSATSTVQDRPLKTFYNPTYGIALNYPDNYEVLEHDVSGEGTKHHEIIIGDKTMLANAPKNGEGPPVMMIDIFDNPGNSTAEKWVKSTSNSNFQPSSDSLLATTTIASENAVAYVWVGLYRGTSIVFTHKKSIYMLSVMYNSPDDQIRKDFAEVASSIQFDP